MTLSRRRFLGAAGALVGAAFAAACGAEEAAQSPPSDADVLAGLLRHERGIAAATAGGTAARALLEQDRSHARRLAREIASLGGVAVAAGPHGDPSGVPARKQNTVFAHVQALPRLSDPRLRVLVMQIAASEAGHLAALRLAAGEDPVPDPFAGFTEGAA